jgi:hypothetical protein
MKINKDDAFIMLEEEEEVVSVFVKGKDGRNTQIEIMLKDGKPIIFTKEKQETTTFDEWYNMNDK